MCRHIYATEQGDPIRGVAAGTPFEELPEDWICPVCGVGKEMFSEEVCSLEPTEVTV